MKLHSNEVEILVDVWTALKNYIPAKDQRQAIEQYLATIEDVGLIDLAVCHKELYGNCELFDRVLKAYCQENGYVDDDYDEDDDWDE